MPVMAVTGQTASTFRVSESSLAARHYPQRSELHIEKKRNRNVQQRATDQHCRKSAADLLPGKSAAFSKAAADLPSPCGGLQPTCRARGGVTRARGAALQGPSAPMRPYLPAGGGASGSRGGNPPCRRLSCARVLAGGRRAEERLCGCAGCRYRATDCGAGLAILWDASAIELPVRFAHCARRWERISPQAQGTLRGQVHLGSAFRA